MRRRRIAPALGLCVALLVTAPVAIAEPTDGSAVTNEPAPSSAPEPQPTPDPTPEPTPTPDPTPDPTPEPTPTTPTPPPTTPPPTVPTTPPPTVPTTPPATPPSPGTPPPGQVYVPPPSPWKGGGTAVYTQPEPTPLTKADITTQLAAADELLTSLSAGNAVLAALFADLEQLTSEANAALERKADAEEVAQKALARASTSRETARQMTIQLERKHQQLRDWAFSAYAEGGSAVELLSVLDAMIKDPSQAGNPVGDLAYLTDQRVRLFADIRHLTARQQQVADRAEEDAETAKTAATEAAKAQADADAAKQKQKDLIASVEKEQSGLLSNAAPLVAMLIGLPSPEARAQGQAILDALTERNLGLPDLDKPCSTDLDLYPNGQLPSSALCPLWMAPGHFARPNASVSFNALSQKFAQDLGRPICVNSSYRSFTQQIAVKASHGRWAATPGTSRHGLGKALDLCGGINDFGTIEHLWMKQNAPMFGWFHPAWAAANGSLPEPWHWEFAG